MEDLMSSETGAATSAVLLQSRERGVLTLTLNRPD
jgi:hypothetical protein